MAALTSGSAALQARAMEADVKTEVALAGAVPRTSPVASPPLATVSPSTLPPSPGVARRLVVPTISRDTSIVEDDEDDDDDMDSMDEIDAHMRDADDEMMYIRKGVLDTVVIQQQKRIAELERKLIRSKQEVVRLKSVKQSLHAAVGSRPHSVGVSANPVVSAQPLQHHHDVNAQATDLSTITVESIGVAKQSQSIVKRPAAKRPGHSTSGIATSLPSVAERVGVLEGQTRYWTADEHERFLRGVEKFGPRNYTAISTFVKSRTPKQVRTHAQKYEMRLAREAVRKTVTPTCSVAPLTPKLDNLQPQVPPPPEATAAVAAIPKLESALSSSKVNQPDQTESQLLVMPGAPSFVEPDMDLLTSDHRPLQSGLDDDAGGVIVDRSVLHSFDRSFSKSDLKSLGNDEDQWLDI